MQTNKACLWYRKLGLYLRAAYETKSINWRGLPLIPKGISHQLPYNRTAYNEFLIWIRRSLQLCEAKIVFDIGANHGVFAQAASACFPSANVFLFEPLPRLGPILESKAAHYCNHWHFYPIGLGAVAGRLPLHVDLQNDAIGSFAGFSKPYAQLAGVREATTVDVSVDTLDNFCKQEGIEHIDLLKIDVEGFEFAVLDGASQMLRSITAIIIETSLVRTANGNPGPFLEMINRLSQQGFYIVALFPSFVQDAHEQWPPYEYNILARRFAV